METMTTVNNTLKERANNYGKFIDHATVTQDLKHVIKYHLNKREKVLELDMREALDMICHKIGRIVNGNANYTDSWHDIAGYASLVDARLKGEEI